MQRDARPDVRLNGRNRLKRRKSEDGASKRLWNGWQVRGKEGKEGAAVVDGGASHQLSQVYRYARCGTRGG